MVWLDRGKRSVHFVSRLIACSSRVVHFFSLVFFYETSIKAVSAMEFHVGRKMVAELFIQRELFRSQVSRIKPSFYTAINFSAVYPDTICYRQLLKHGLAFKYTCFLIPLASPIISSTQYMTHYIRLFEKCLSFTDASLYKHET